MDSELVTVFLNGTEAGRGHLTITPGKQRLHRMSQLGGPPELIQGRKDPDGAVLALDTYASVEFYSGSNRVEVMAPNGVRAVMQVERSEGTVGQVTLVGFLRPLDS